MQIIELQLKNFGKFSNQTIRFENGVNVISGANEMGKTTIHAFIRGMLFGIQRQRGRAARGDEYSLRRPWENGSSYAGVLRFESGGKIFRLERSFDQRDKFVWLVCETDGEELSIEDRDLELLLEGLNEDSFRNTVFISQKGSETDAGLAKELQNYMTNLQNTGNADINVHQALQRLTERRKLLERERKKLQQAAAEQMQNLKVQLEYIEQDIIKLQEEQQEYTRQKQALDSSLKQFPESSEHWVSKPQEWAEHLVRKPHEPAEHLAHQFQEPAEHLVRKPQEWAEHWSHQPQESADPAAQRPGKEQMEPTKRRQTRQLKAWEKRVSKWQLVVLCLFLMSAVVGGVLSSQMVIKIGLLFISALLVGLLGWLCFRQFRQNTEADKKSAQNIQAQPWRESQERILGKQERTLEELKEKTTIKGNLQEALAEAVCEDGGLMIEMQALQLAADTIHELSEQIYQESAMQLNHRIGEILAEITDGRYTRIFLDTDMKVRIHTPNQLLTLDQVSRGTADQIYFAMRMAAGEMLCHQEPVPIILDDAFAMYDEKRLRKTLNWLAGTNRQVLLFTCHQREEQILQSILTETKFHVIELQKIV